MSSKLEAYKRTLYSQSFSHAMPAGCTYDHLRTIIKPMNTSFFQNSDIKKIFLAHILSDNNLTNKFNKHHFLRLYEINKKDVALSVHPWPSSFLFNKEIKEVNMEPGDLCVFLISVDFNRSRERTQKHASAAIAYKQNENEIDFFVLEPHGKIYDYHIQIAKKYFKEKIKFYL